MSSDGASRFAFSDVMVLTVLLMALQAIAFWNYLLFHSLIEIFSIIVGCGIFIVAWNSRAISGSSFLGFLGIAYLWVAVLDLFHTLAYSGMGIFPGADPNLATQLWIAARYLESASLLLAPSFLGRSIRHRKVLALYSLLGLGLLAVLLLTPWFPDCWAEGRGLTPFKIASEYAIITILSAAVIRYARRRSGFEPRIYGWLIASLVLTAGAEAAFTLYISVVGLSNMIGHLFKVVSFYLIYKSAVAAALLDPYSVLFRDLKERERELQDALARVKTLSGLLPVCASCKKIRTEGGSWQPMEHYTAEHSEASFSHGLCPDCLRRQGRGGER